MIRIFTDTSANLPQALIRQYDITVVPFHYIVDGKEHAEDEEFDGSAFYNAMREGMEVKTSMVNVFSFCEAFEKAVTAGHDVIYVGMSGGISGTAEAAAIAVKEMKERYPARQIAAVDTKAASLGEGLPVLYAAKAAQNGVDFAEIVRDVTENSKSICQFFTVEDLTYLKKSGRVFKAIAVVGNILNIKPILKGDEEGRIVLFHKVRGRKRSLHALVDKYKELVADEALPIGIAHGDCETEADYVAKKLRETNANADILSVCYEPVTGSHVGPGTVALFFYGIHR